jgi:hypothetical protein
MALFKLTDIAAHHEFEAFKVVDVGTFALENR